MLDQVTTCITIYVSLPYVYQVVYNAINNQKNNSSQTKLLFFSLYQQIWLAELSLRPLAKSSDMLPSLSNGLSVCNIFLTAWILIRSGLATEQRDAILKPRVDHAYFYRRKEEWLGVCSKSLLFSLLVMFHSWLLRCLGLLLCIAGVFSQTVCPPVKGQLSCVCKDDNGTYISLLSFGGKTNNPRYS